MSLKNVKGQTFAVKFLEKAISSDRLAGTYLFHGPQGVGKELAAREFAKSLNCTQRDGSSCDRCDSCTKIAKDMHPDVSWIYPVGKSRHIKIDQVRKLQKFISWKAYEGRFKVGIIVDAHTLNVESGNALLKTLEEPPPNSILILITHMPESLLPTIISRAQDIQFYHLGNKIIAEILEEKEGYTKEEADLISRLAFGSLRHAVLFKDKDLMEIRKFILEVLSKGSFNGIKELIDGVAKIQDILELFKEKLAEKERAEQEKNRSLSLDAYVAGEYKNQVEDILDLILGWYRDILICKFVPDISLETSEGNKVPVLNRDYIDRIKYWAKEFSASALYKRMGVVDEIRWSLSRQINIKLLFQTMFVQLELV